MYRCDERFLLLSALILFTLTHCCDNGGFFQLVFFKGHTFPHRWVHEAQHYVYINVSNRQTVNYASGCARVSAGLLYGLNIGFPHTDFNVDDKYCRKLNYSGQLKQRAPGIYIPSVHLNGNVKHFQFMPLILDQNRQIHSSITHLSPFTS